MSQNGFTQAANNVLQAAQEQARSFHHEYIGTDHMLLALMLDPDVRTVLEANGVGAETLTEETKKLMVAGPDGNSPESIPHTARTTEIIEEAVAVSKCLGHDGVSPLHLLIACMSIRGVASDILMQHKLIYENLYETAQRHAAGLPLKPQ